MAGIGKKLQKSKWTLFIWMVTVSQWMALQQATAGLETFTVIAAGSVPFTSGMGFVSRVYFLLMTGCVRKTRALNQA